MKMVRTTPQARFGGGLQDFTLANRCIKTARTGRLPRCNTGASGRAVPDRAAGRKTPLPRAALRHGHPRAPLGRMRLSLAALTLFALALPASADPLHDALTKLQERYESTRTMTASFTQDVSSPTLAGTLESRGTLAFEKP